MKKATYLLIYLGFILFMDIPAFSAQGINEPGNADRPLENLQKLEHFYSQQKVYLHIDKEQYLAGENIWFKAYVVNVSTHEPAANNENLHVELFNEEGNYIDFSLLRVEHGLAIGDFHLPDSLHEGGYLIRAYTDKMRNFDEGFYFERKIHVVNPIEEDFIRWRERRRNRRFNRDLEDKAESMQFAFFPEGGQLVAGLNNRVAFKAANLLGEGVPAKGVLLNENGNEILTFETFHEGMGRFSFKPEPGMNYKARVTFHNGTEAEYRMMAPLRETYLLEVNQKEGGVQVVVRKDPSADSNSLSGDISILAHTRNRVQFFQKARLINGFHETTIPYENLPDGISHITVFNNNQTPVAERLVFVYEDGIRNVDVIAGKSINGDQEERLLELAFDLEPDAVGSYSLAVIAPNNPDGLVKNDNIANYLLITSDLKGMIKNSGYYLSKNDKNIKKAADLLMMTHGWRRFNWEQVIAGEFPEITHKPPVGITISGKIESTMKRFSFGGVPVKLLVSAEGEETTYNTESDRTGYFSFSGLEYENFFMAELSIETTAPHRAYEITLDQRGFENIKISKNFLTPKRRVLSRGDDWSRASRPDYTLKPFRQPQRKGSRSYYGEPDQVVYLDEIQTPYTNMHDLLRTQIRGLTIRDGNVLLRGVSSFQASNEPVFIVDGNTVDKGAFMGLRPDEVEKVEVLSGASAAILGVRGANGALIAYTRRSADLIPPSYEFGIRGYNTPTEFYDTKIESDFYKQEEVNKTVFWHPNLTPDANGKVEIRLPENGKQEKLFIVIEGIDEKGNISLQTETVSF